MVTDQTVILIQTETELYDLEPSPAFSVFTPHSVRSPTSGPDFNTRLVGSVNLQTLSIVDQQIPNLSDPLPTGVEEAAQPPPTQQPTTAITNDDHQPSLSVTWPTATEEAVQSPPTQQPTTTITNDGHQPSLSVAWSTAAEEGDTLLVVTPLDAQRPATQQPALLGSTTERPVTPPDYARYVHARTWRGYNWYCVRNMSIYSISMCIRSIA